MNFANLNTNKINARTNRIAACLTVALLITLGAAFGAGAQAACLTAVDSPETGATVCATQTSDFNQIDRGTTPDGLFQVGRLRAQTFIPAPVAASPASVRLETEDEVTVDGYRVEVRITSVMLPAEAGATVAAVVAQVAGQYAGFQEWERLEASEADFAFALGFEEPIELPALEAELNKALSAFAVGEVLLP